jgi:hypothetical protein
LFGGPHALARRAFLDPQRIRQPGVRGSGPQRLGLAYDWLMAQKTWFEAPLIVPRRPTVL